MNPDVSMGDEIAGLRALLGVDAAARLAPHWRTHTLSVGASVPLRSGCVQWIRAGVLRRLARGVSPPSGATLDGVRARPDPLPGRREMDPLRTEADVDPLDGLAGPGALLPFDGGAGDARVALIAVTEVHLAEASLDAVRAAVGVVGVARLQAEALLEAAPALRGLPRDARHRLACAGRMVTLKPGDVLTRPGRTPDAALVLGMGVEVEVVDGDGRRLVLSWGGDLMAVSALTGDRATAEARVLRGGSALRLSPRAWGRARAPRGRFGHDPLVRWLLDRQEIETHADALSKAIAAHARLAAPDARGLLQGAIALLWRVGPRPVAPVGRVAGMLAVLDGEIVWGDGDFRPLAWHRGGGVIDVPDRHADGVRWRARTPTRAVFVSGALVVERGVERGPPVTCPTVDAPTGRIVVRPLGGSVPDAALDRLCARLAAAIEADFGEAARAGGGTRRGRWRWRVCRDAPGPGDHVAWLAVGPASAPPGTGDLGGSTYTRLLGEAPGCPGGEPPGAVRLAIDADALLRGDLTRPEVTAALSRWARAVTGRLVGVALGGGGGLGLAHLAVLFHLERQGVPVDLVSACSFGSVVGSWYCTRGLGGLADLLAGFDALQSAHWRGMLHGSALQRYVADALGDPHLEALPTRFLPIATDLVRASELPLLGGHLGAALRASTALPPFFPAVIGRHGVLADGGLSANVPARVLRDEGAGLVIASNCVPPPQNARMPLLGSGALAETLDAVNPVGRLWRAWNGLWTLIHTVGDATASAADVHFDTIDTNRLPISLGDAPAHLADVRCAPGFRAAVEDARDAWDKLRGPSTHPPAR